MMRVADGNSQRIRRIVGVEFGAGKENRHHHSNLRLFGMTGANDRFLDDVRRVFGDGYPGAGGDKHRYATGLAEF